MKRGLASGLCAAFLLAAAPASAAETFPTIIVHAGKTDSLSHALAVQFAGALASGNSALTIQVEESQGSVRNILDAVKIGRPFIFTASPSLIAQARRGEKPFARNRRYRDIRALFPIPPLTVHWVVRADSGASHLTDLAARPFAPGAKGSFAEQQTVSALHVLGLDRQVQLIDIDAAGAKAAFASKQITGLALAGTYPMPAVTALADAAPIRLLSLSRDELAKVLAADDNTVAEVIPKGTYPGVDEDVTTIAQPAGAYTTTRMSDRLAYAITKAFWSQKSKLGLRNPPWTTVSPDSLASLGVRLHPGALRYYREAGIKVPKSLR